MDNAAQKVFKTKNLFFFGKKKPFKEKKLEKELCWTMKFLRGRITLLLKYDKLLNELKVKRIREKMLQTMKLFEQFL